MRRNVFTKTAPNVVCALAMLFVSNGSFAQIQRSPTEAQSRDVGWAPPTIAEPNRPYLSDPSRRTSGLGSGSEDSTPILHESAKLTASDAAPGDLFGVSVSIDGDTAVIGAYTDNCAAGDECGSAYVYRFNGTDWVEEQKLTASDAEAFARFGVSVSVSGETAIVGA